MRTHLLLLGKGTVGGQLLTTLADAEAALKRDYDLDVRVAGVADRRAVVFDETGIDPGTARARLLASETRADLAGALDRLASLTTPVLVDCTAADAMDGLYREAFARGIHVVTANKKPFATPTADRDGMFAAARRHRVALRFETTVGASLPVIETLRNLVRTGDRIRSIEGSFSGTLGFLVGEVSRGESLSSALATARARGYTEPHPREDLGGVDVARKALILAREIGLVLELSDVEVQPLVPESLLRHDDVDAFLHALAGYDDAFRREVLGLHAEGRELRYLATIDPDAHAGPLGGREGPAPRPKVRVGPVGVGPQHPARNLRGTEAFVAFHSERYHEYPLVVQGPGAGGALTASGVLADVLAIAQQVRGR